MHLAGSVDIDRSMCTSQYSPSYLRSRTHCCFPSILRQWSMLRAFANSGRPTLVPTHGLINGAACFRRRRSDLGSGLSGYSSKDPLRRVTAEENVAWKRSKSGSRKWKDRRMKGSSNVSGERSFSTSLMSHLPSLDVRRFRMLASSTSRDSDEPCGNCSIEGSEKILCPASVVKRSSTSSSVTGGRAGGPPVSSTRSRHAARSPRPG